MYKIFLVEDDNVIANQVEKHLRSWNYEVIIAKDFHDIMSDFAKSEADLVLLDISLPFFDGFYWCRHIRQISKLPIVFISGAGDNLNIVMAMNMGADDFICKPFDLNVLTAKIQALLRRAYDFSEGETADVIEHDGIILNMKKMITLIRLLIYLEKIIPLYTLVPSLSLSNHLFHVLQVSSSVLSY